MPRTYSQDEVAAILKEAYRLSDGTHESENQPGLTLAELESMATEHGLDAGTIRMAAARLHTPSGTEPYRTYAGIRWKVGHRSVLNGPVTDQQWAEIVADCRQQFEARGEQSVDGQLRTWKNGNLFVSAEPSVDGASTVLHMGSRNDNIPGLIGGGLGPLVMTLIFSTLALAGVDPDLFVVAAMLAPIGLALSGSGVMLGRSWIRNRERQMALIADRAIQRQSVQTGALQAETPPLKIDDLDVEAPETEERVDVAARRDRL